MPVVTYRLNGGLVTSRDPSTLQPGELQTCDDAEYHPNDDAIHKVPGRTEFNETVEASKIKGAVFLEFDGDIFDTFVTHVGNKYRIATAGDSGTFSDLVSVTTGGDTLDAVHYNNQHFLLNGVDRNEVVTSTSSTGATVNPPASSSVEKHGLLAETAAPTLSETGGSGTGFMLDNGSTRTYWFEERVKVGSTVTKRNAATSDETTTLTGDGATTYKPLLTHTQVNSDATHIALFATATNGSFPTGAEISEEAIGATNSIEDTNTTDNPSIPSGTVYETWVATLFGAVVSTARNGQPPVATTGDVFEDSLVTNDVDDERAIRYSWPDTPHAFPVQQRIPFETKEHDEVVLIRRMGLVLMVALRDSLWRVNILPRPEDASFDVARIKEQIEGAFGCVGTYAGTVFSFGTGLRLAYVSRSGIVMANEAQWNILTDDIDWDNTVSIPNLSQSILTDNPQKYRLEFYYTPKGEVENTKALYLNYHRSHLKPGLGGVPKMKVTGPINVKSTAAFLAIINSERKVFTASNGKLWVEGKGDKDFSNAGGIQMEVRTGDVYPNGIGGEAQIRRHWTHHQKHEGQSLTVAINQRNEGDDDNEQLQTISLARRELTQVALTAQAENFQFAFKNSDERGPVTIDYFAVDYDQLGESEEG